MDPYNGQQERRGGGLISKGRILIALVVAVISVVTYYSKRELNPVTQQVQHIDVTPEQEIALGLQAAPEMAQQYGGLHPDQKAQGLVDQVCARIIEKTQVHDTPYRFDCHVLADEETINAFALPGGQVFITAGLMGHLQTEGQLAGVLGHEIGHVVARHSAAQMAKAKLTQGLTGAAVLATYDPNDPSSQRNAAVAAMIANLVNMKFGRQDELEADHLGVRFVADAGYDPRAMLTVMEILQRSSGAARQPEFFSTHPNPENRAERIQAAIGELYPQGVPDGLKG
jgi:predicted Zn-dependent protease